MNKLWWIVVIAAFGLGLYLIDIAIGINDAVGPVGRVGW